MGFNSGFKGLNVVLVVYTVRSVLYLVFTRHTTILRYDGKQNKKNKSEMSHYFAFKSEIISGHSISREANSSRNSQQNP